jgi:hypothetical protein
MISGDTTEGHIMESQADSKKRVSDGYGAVLLSALGQRLSHYQRLS